ncbi:MAG: hypothetical protein H0Z33_13615 [Bacillaceae bacterium]|nr:hypothetical protein [Bacillaceae bacterium]
MEDFYFIILISVIILQRLLELVVARRNEKIIKSMGGYEAGKEHYKYMVLFHVAFFVSVLAEAGFRGVHVPPWWPVPFTLFILAQILRYWCIYSLGPFWNTKIMVLPGSVPVVRGPYRFLRHPNYVTVTLELLVIPLLFGLTVSAILFPLANILLLKKVRIPAEEKALAATTAYGDIMSEVPRLFPLRSSPEKPGPR